jgi:hypothetical protein
MAAEVAQAGIGREGPRDQRAGQDEDQRVVPRGAAQDLGEVRVEVMGKPRPLIRGDHLDMVEVGRQARTFGRAIGADAYCRDAAVAVETAKAFMARRHNRLSA